MKRIVKLSVLFAAMPLFTGCSDNDDLEPNTDPVPEEKVDTRGYYYQGDIKMYDAKTDKAVYGIREPLMYPMLYGHTIPIPAPDYACYFTLNFYENSVIEENSVCYTYNSEEFKKDMPSVGETVEYWDGFSITRISENEYKVFMDPGRADGYDDIMVRMRPIPFRAFDDFVPEWYDFKDAGDFDLPEVIGVEFLPYTFTDNYRPIVQYHLEVYK